MKDVKIKYNDEPLLFGLVLEGESLAFLFHDIQKKGATFKVIRPSRPILQSP